MEKLQDGLATIKVSFEKDTIRIDSKNVNRFELDLKDRRDDLPILLNGSLLKKTTKQNRKLNVFVDTREDQFPFKKNNLIEGPINHAFASNFKVVFNNRNQTIKDTLNALWQDMYFNDLLSIREKDISTEDIENSNLILIGTQFHNETIQRIMDQLPIQIHKDHIVFRKKRINGDNVLVSFVYPNPLNSDKYIVLIASNAEIKSMPIRDFSNDGESDFMIFQHKGNSYELTSSGNFDNDWR